ncbi:HD-GYP domain-containing protein [Deinococcus arenicola]|uniref:HD domain-containing protein n=1 Tax=Deinococcus arenicola TaxID=2994950 RepID=A0ABU4DTX4_9DEIO|nr:HD domain-containing phosphohydrolase [Deinococcus sp. ZS9-10]MDV6375539.1 HD domain-containing protein [Deinococcus sp. ZS9-10]
MRLLGDLLNRPTSEGVLEAALSHASVLLGGDVSGYAVLRRSQDQDRVAAVFGYPRMLVGTPLSGPWSMLRPRMLTDGSRELYEANPPEMHGILDSCDMRAVTLSLVVPVTDRGRNRGALVLDRSLPSVPVAGGTTPTGEFSPEAQELVTRWATATAPLLGLIESREKWKVTARQISSAMVEAAESQEFDALGHAQAVAEASLTLGRAVGLVERELEELWFAATLHDLGKIHGENGHAQVGANFLHGVTHLPQAQKAIRHHHESWDGHGEPDQLAGEDIPLYARIVAVADAYVRLGGMEQLRGQAGKQLDPRLMALLEKASAEPSAQ